MIDRNPAVAEEELHAYVDGELAPDRRVAVEAWLASHPEDAARVAQWRSQAELGKMFRSAGIDAIQLRTDQPYAAALGRFFETREKRRLRG